MALTPDRGVSAALLAINCAGFLISLDRAVFAPLLPAMADDLNGSIAAVGLAVSFYAIPYGLFQIVFGPIGDRRGKIQVIRWNVLLFALGTGLCGAVAALPALYGLRAVTGICAAAVFPLSLAFIGDAVPYARRQQAITTLLGVSSLGGALSTAVGGLIGEFLSWRALFYLYSVVSLVVAFMLFRVPAKAPVAVSGPWWEALAGYRKLASVPRARLLYAMAMIEGAIILGAFTYVGAFVRERYELDYLMIGLVLACYAVGTLIATRLLRRFAGQSREASLVLGGGVVMGLGYLALMLAPVWQLIPIVLYGTGTGFALLHSTLQTRATELVPALRGTAVAIFAFSLFLGGGIGTAFFGAVVSEASYELAFGIAGAVLIGLGLFARRIW